MPPKTLHDRVILIDGVTSRNLRPPFNALATQAHTSLTKVGHEPGLNENYGARRHLDGSVTTLRIKRCRSENAEH